MRNIAGTGRIAFALSIILLGVLHLYFKMLIAPIVPLTKSGLLFWIYLFGVFLIISGISIGLKLWVKKFSALVAIVFSLLLIFSHFPILISNYHDAREWTRAFELLAITGGAIIIAFSFNKTARAKHNNIFLKLGSLFYNVSLLIFAILHFIYAPYIANVIPNWIPGHLFWAYFIGTAFLAVFISIIFKIKVQLSTFLLGTMFFMWVLILHLPRCFADLHNEAEWSSAFVALAMGGIAFILSSSFSKTSKRF